MLPQPCNVIVIPTLLSTERARKTMRAVNSHGTCVVITKGSKYWPANVLLEETEDTGLRILYFLILFIN